MLLKIYFHQIVLFVKQLQLIFTVNLLIRYRKLTNKLIADKSVPEWQEDSPTPEEVEAAVAAGKSSLAAKDKLEASNPGLPVNSPSYRHQVAIKTSARATNLARSAYIMEEATKKFVL